MTQLPGFRKVNTFSALEVDQTFDQAMQLLNIRGTKDQYQFSEEANILFGTKYKVLKESNNILHLYRVFESVTFNGQTFDQYYRDEYNLAYVYVSGGNVLICIGNVYEGTYGATDVIPTYWNKNTSFLVEDYPDTFSHDFLLYLNIQPTIDTSLAHCVLPEECRAIGSLNNWSGVMDISNGAPSITIEELINCDDGTFLISSEQAVSLGDRIVDGKLDNSIQVVVKSE